MLGIQPQGKFLFDPADIIATGIVCPLLQLKKGIKNAQMKGNTVPLLNMHQYRHRDLRSPS